jgi:protein-tyrosine phosphatase
VTDGPTFNVLFVCTGNICRSAFAELLCRQLFDDRLGPAVHRCLAFSSAGLQAAVGSGMHPDTRGALALWGYPLYEAGAAFVARPLRPHMVAWADLILTAEESHRSEIAWSAPEAAPKLFTLRRFGRIAGTLDPAALPCGLLPRAHALVTAAAASGEPLKPAEDSIPDPIGRPPDEHLRMADVIFEALGRFVDLAAPRR